MNIIENHDARSRYIEEVAAYIRVSTQEQKLHGISLEAQVAKLKEYAAEHNMKIVEWYKDEGVSGRKLIKNRPELQRMIHDAQKKKFKRIIFIKLDRFFRSVAEYHECMKKIHPIIWTATEEKFDLSTASGEAFVNMKLTMAQFEADQAGERTRMTNEYKIKTGQPLVGSQSLPFCFTVADPDDGERHKYIAKRNEAATMDLINHVLTNRSIAAGANYIRAKYDMEIGYNSVMKALKNTMLYGMYRGNPNYCEPYISKETFDELQAIIKRNPRTTGSEHAYAFSGLIKCPLCGCRLGGTLHTTKKKGRTVRYHVYRCNKYRKDRMCSFAMTVFENNIERMMLNQLEGIIANKKARITQIESVEKKASKDNLADLQSELDRLNYSWQKGRIRTVEEYDKRYDALQHKIEQVMNHETEKEPDYTKIQEVLSDDWKTIYAELDWEHKRSFWRTFIEAIEIEWTKEVKRIVDIDFL